MFSSAHDIWSHEIELLLLWWCILQTKSSWSGHCWWSRAIIRSVRFRFLIPLAWCAWHYGRTDLSLAVSFSILIVDQCLMQSWLSERGLHEEQSKNMLVNESFSWYMKLSMCVSMVSSNHCHVICWLLYSTDTILEWNSYCLWVAVNTCRINHEFLLGSICEQGQFCNCIFYHLAWVIQKRLP